jgi:hypothetical protein
MPWQRAAYQMRAGGGTRTCCQPYRVRRCSFLRPSVEAEEEVHGKMPPIKVKFEIPYFTVSGIQVSAKDPSCHSVVFLDVCTALCGLQRGTMASSWYVWVAGAVLEGHREERVPGAALGALHHMRRQL